jgi:hypothetical protein
MSPNTSPASANRLTAEFTLTPDDLYGYYYCSIPRAKPSLTTKILRVLFLTVLTCAFVYFWEWIPISTMLSHGWGGFIDPWMYFQVLFPVGVFGLALVIALITSVTRRLNARNAIKGLSDEDLLQSLVASPSGFEFGGRDTYGRYRWSEVLGINEDRRVIAFDCLSNRVFGYRSRLKVLIPKRIYSGKAEVKAVVARLRSFQENAVSSPLDAGVALFQPDDQIAGLPFEPDDAMVWQLQRARWSEGKGVWQSVGTAAAIGSMICSLAYVQYYITHDIFQPLFTLVVYGIFVPLVSRRVRSIYRPRAGTRYAAAGTHSWRDIGPQFLAVGSHHFAVSDVYGTVSYTWDVVEFIKVYKGNLIVSFLRSQGLVIPGRTFSSEAELNSFTELLTATWKGEPYELADDTEPVSWPPPPSWRVKRSPAQNNETQTS